MSKKKIKIRDSIFLLVIICALIFRKKRYVLSIAHSNGWSKRAIISTKTHQYDIVFSGGNVTVNRQKYVMDESMDSVLDQFYRSLNETEGKYN